MLELIGLITVIYLFVKVVGSALGTLVKVLLGLVLLFFALPFVAAVFSWFMYTVLLFWAVLLSSF